MATPRATRLRTRNTRVMSGANMAPRTPVTITAATVMEVMPPSCWETAMAMGVVTDLGTNESAMSSPKPSSLHNPYALTMETMEPTKQPAKIGAKCFFRIWRCWYTEYASATVAGPSKNEITRTLSS